MTTITSATSPDNAQSNTQTVIIQNPECQQNLLKIKEFFQRIWFAIQNFFAEFLECPCVKYHLSMESVKQLNLLPVVEALPALVTLIDRLGFSIERLCGEEEIDRFENLNRSIITAQNGFNMPFQRFQKCLHAIESLHRFLLWMNTPGDKHTEHLYICSTTGQFFATSDITRLPTRYTPEPITDLYPEVTTLTEIEWENLLTNLWAAYPQQTTESEQGLISIWIRTQRSALNDN